MNGLIPSYAAALLSSQPSSAAGTPNEQDGAAVLAQSTSIALTSATPQHWLTAEERCKQEQGLTLGNSGLLCCNGNVKYWSGLSLDEGCMSHDICSLAARLTPLNSSTLWLVGLSYWMLATLLLCFPPCDYICLCDVSIRSTQRQHCNICVGRFYVLIFSYRHIRPFWYFGSVNAIRFYCIYFSFKRERAQPSSAWVSRACYMIVVPVLKLVSTHWYHLVSTHCYHLVWACCPVILMVDSAFHMLTRPLCWLAW